MSYDPQYYKVINLFIVPRHFFTPEIIIARKPLSDSAKRAGWLGCNINLKAIPEDGKIYIIKNNIITPNEVVTKQFHKMSFLDNESTTNRSWSISVLNCINRLQTPVFSLEDLYQFESLLSKAHPNNSHIKAKIRQQLQYLRDKNIIDFISRGMYRKK